MTNFNEKKNSHHIVTKLTTKIVSKNYN